VINEKRAPFSTGLPFILVILPSCKSWFRHFYLLLTDFFEVFLAHSLSISSSDKPVNFEILSRGSPALFISLAISMLLSLLPFFSPSSRKEKRRIISCC